jgi:hypothetical protein
VAALLDPPTTLLGRCDIGVRQLVATRFFRFGVASAPRRDGESEIIASRESADPLCPKGFQPPAVEWLHHTATPPAPERGVIPMPRNDSLRWFDPTDLLVDLDGVVNILHSSPGLPLVRAECDGFRLQGNPAVLVELDHLISTHNLRPT